MKVTVKGAKKHKPGKYIALWYLEYQNEPSTPCDELVELDGTAEGLKEHMKQVFTDEANNEDVEISCDNGCGFADISWTDNEGIWYLLTKLKE